MNSVINSHDLIQIGGLLLVSAVGLGRLESTTKWIRQWCQEHKADDERNFERLQADVRELRASVRAAREQA